MAVIKCKMCGGDLVLTPDSTVAECEYCGTRQTVPTADSEKKLTLFARANRLRLACEFDKAAGVYENIVSEFPTEAEAYWGLVLCRYGIEYVDDPATGKKVPTCHRSSFDSILEDSDFEQACENADPIARRVYRDEAKAIEDIRRGILEVSGKEPPYDIFICYKETDENGARTVDSVLAQDVYDALTEKGYRVFFSRITLEDKLGTEYEPYIFAALNSAKLMLVFGTDYEYFNAVWVKNEWSRFLKLMAQDKNKHLIPCYKDVDAYDMPKEFQKLQGQDMGKVGAVQDLLRGIDKLLGKGAAAQAAPAAPAQPTGGPTADSLLKRGQMFLEAGDNDSAINYFNNILDLDPENEQAYLGIIMAVYGAADRKGLAERWHSFEEGEKYPLVKVALKHISQETRNWLAEQEVNHREKKRLEAEIERKKAEQEQREKEREEKALKARLADCRQRIAPAARRIAVGENFLIALKSDGTVLAAGEISQSKIAQWREIRAVFSGNFTALGLRRDGTAVFTHKSSLKMKKEFHWTDEETLNWENLVDLATYASTFGLKADGTVIASFYPGVPQGDLSSWENIVAVVPGAGLRADGTVVTYIPESDVSQWRNIVQIASNEDCLCGLRDDGSVLVTGKMLPQACLTNPAKAVSSWREIIAVSMSSYHIMGLRTDGTVVTCGNNAEGRCDVSGWSDIVAIEAGDTHSVGIKADGTIVTTAPKIVPNKLQEAQTWKLFESLDTVDQEMAEAQAQHKIALEKEQTALQAELANLKGIFSGGKRRQVEARLAEIEAELARL